MAVPEPEDSTPKEGETPEPGLTDFYSDLDGENPNVPNTDEPVREAPNEDGLPPISEGALTGDPPATPTPETPHEPEPKPVPPVEPVAPVTEPTPTPTPTPAPAPAPEPAPVGLDPKTMVEVDGRMVSLEALIQTSRQFPHIQKKYLEKVEAEKSGFPPVTPRPAITPGQPTPVAPAPAPVAPAPGVTAPAPVAPPVLEEPKFLRELKDSDPDQYEYQKSQFEAVHTVVQQLTQATQYQEAMNAMFAASYIARGYYDAADSLKTHYPELANEDVKEAFKSYLVGFDPSAAQAMDPQFLMPYYEAFRRLALATGEPEPTPAPVNPQVPVNGPQPAPVINANTVRDRAKRVAQEGPGARIAEGGDPKREGEEGKIDTFMDESRNRDTRR